MLMLVALLVDFDDFVIYPLYAAMPPDEQLKVFQPSPKGKRKFVQSTNVAETSVTISGIKYGKICICSGVEG